MKLKKLLGIISILIVVVFSMMLTTSYAWYAFDNASTVFEGMTNNDDIIVSYQKGEYINVTNAIPISSNQIDTYSDKNNFNIVVKNDSKDTEILVSISLVEISIDRSLQNVNFKVELYHQSDKIADIAGNGIGTNSATTKKLAEVILDNNVTNNFELRLYILDDGTNQTSLESKSFQAKIQVDVVSRLKHNLKDYNNADINISSVTIDGEESNYIPADGYYDMTATCSKGSNLTWEPLSKTITYNSGSYMNDNCSLSFTSSTDYPLLSEMPVGSYVKYTGTNGCDGIHCEGYNENYVSDTDTGICDGGQAKIYANGWRIGYIEDGSAHLISAGSPECIRTYVYSKSTTTSNQNLSTNYYYGSGYKFNDVNGTFTLTGVTETTLSWSDNYESIISNTPFTCKSASSTGTCTTLYEITSYNSNTEGVTYPHYNYETTSGYPIHMEHLNKTALKYCNSNYAYGGVCNNTTAWSMNGDDYEIMNGNSVANCYAFSTNNPSLECGWKNDLLNTNDTYYIVTDYVGLGRVIYVAANGRVTDYNGYTSKARGFRPILKLDSSIIVIGGAGTYKDPYIIKILE